MPGKAVRYYLQKPDKVCEALDMEIAHLTPKQLFAEMMMIAHHTSTQPTNCWQVHVVRHEMSPISVTRGTYYPNRVAP